MDERERGMVDGLVEPLREIVEAAFRHFGRELRGSRYRLSLPGSDACRRSDEAQFRLFMTGRRPVVTLRGIEYAVVGKTVTDCDGTTKKSYHQTGRAVDIGFRDTESGAFVWFQSRSVDEPHLLFRRLARFLQFYGLEWGGDWTKRKGDFHHFQLPKEREA